MSFARSPDEPWLIRLARRVVPVRRSNSDKGKPPAISRRGLLSIQMVSLKSADAIVCLVPLTVRPCTEGRFVAPPACTRIIPIHDRTSVVRCTIPTEAPRIRWLLCHGWNCHRHDHHHGSNENKYPLHSSTPIQARVVAPERRFRHRGAVQRRCLARHRTSLSTSSGVLFEEFSVNSANARRHPYSP